MKFEIGDCVTPKKNWNIGYDRKYWIRNYNKKNKSYQLSTEDRFEDEIDRQVALAHWYENELDFYVGVNCPSPDNPVKITVHPTEVTVGKNLFSSVNSNNSGITYGIDTDNSISINRRETDMKDIIGLCYGRKENEINKKYDEKITQLRENDEIQQIVNEMNEQIKTIIENEGHEYLNKIYFGRYTSKTERAVNELLKEKETEIKKLREDIKSIDALFDLTEDYNERMKILKNYGFVDKNYKLIV